jgi:hypothetical protein
MLLNLGCTTETQQMFIALCQNQLTKCLWGSDRCEKIIHKDFQIITTDNLMNWVL